MLPYSFTLSGTCSARSTRSSGRAASCGWPPCFAPAWSLIGCLTRRMTHGSRLWELQALNDSNLCLMLPPPRCLIIVQVLRHGAQTESTRPNVRDARPVLPDLFTSSKNPGRSWVFSERTWCARAPSAVRSTFMDSGRLEGTEPCHPQVS